MYLGFVNSLYRTFSRSEYESLSWSASAPRPCDEGEIRLDRPDIMADPILSGRLLLVISVTSGDLDVIS